MKEPKFKTIWKWTTPLLYVLTVIWMLSDGLPAEKDPVGYMVLLGMAGFLASVASFLLSGAVLVYLELSRSAQRSGY